MPKITKKVEERNRVANVRAKIAFLREVILRRSLALRKRETRQAIRAAIRHRIASGINKSVGFVASRFRSLRAIPSSLHSLRVPIRKPPRMNIRGNIIPSQLVRWDMLGVTMSYLWGKVNSKTLPVWARSPLYKAWAYTFKANLQEAREPLNSYPCLRDFFSRSLKDGVRPVTEAGMASPVDAKILCFGEVTGDRVEHVKGITYPVSGFLGSSVAAVKVSPHTKLFHMVLYLAPGDYHRIHSPVDMDVKVRRHFPGTLFPVAPAVGRVIPNLLALNERVVLNGTWSEGFYSLSAVGAYNVGSISVNFDPEVKTNMITRDYKCPNLRYFSYGGVGSYAYEKVYEPLIPLKKGDEIGAFNLGSTVVLFFECADFAWSISPGQKVRMGEKIGDVVEPAPLTLEDETSES